MENVEKIINGMLYSTANATLIAVCPTGDLSPEQKLFKTLKGNYFTSTKKWVASTKKGVELESCITPVSKEEARKFFENNDQKVSYFEAFDEEIEIA